MSQRLRDYCDYSFKKHYRRAWELSRMTSLVFDTLALAIGILLLLVLLAWTEQSLAEAEMLGRASGEAERLELEAKEKKTSELLANALNQKPVLDRQTGTVYFFQVSKQEGL